MPSSYIFEGLVKEVQGSNSGNIAIFPIIPSSITTSTSYTTLYLEENYDGWTWQPTINSMSLNSGYQDLINGAYEIYSYTVSGSSGFFQVNYSKTTPTETGYTSITYIGFGSYTDTLQGYWLRTRAYPPNGVMPSIAFGSIS